MATYRLGQDEFVIDDYANARAFSSFLPGIAGLWGIPMWVFYVNRGQGIAGFGIQDKDHPIMEFQPANKAYRLVPREGFRTFIKRVSAPGQPVIEPFQTTTLCDQGKNRTRAIRRRMRIRMHDLMLEESNSATGIDMTVHYFTVPHEPFAGLSRRVTLTNTSRKPQSLEVIDGLPVIIPHGMRDWFLKNMSRTIEAWVRVINMEHRAPFYNLRVEPNDRPEVVPIRGGNYFVSVLEQGKRSTPLQPIIDPAVVFGQAADLGTPELFMAGTFRFPAKQLVADKMPSAMTFTKLKLAPGESATLSSLFGHVDAIEQLNPNLPRILEPGFFERKAEENRALIADITQPLQTQSGLKAFDQYCRQTYLDNAMRGGIPVILGKKTSGQGASRKVVYVYARKHGDLERDYNYFTVPPTHFSQGNANYRDVNQNRRNDPWFYPEAGEQNIVTFFNLIQADGYNPLVFKGTRYIDGAGSATASAIRELTAKSFTPGELLRQLDRRHVKLAQNREDLLDALMASAEEIEDADHGEGFWTDHWTYNLDLLERYLALFPDRLRHILIEKKDFTFYDNSHGVAPRSKKYRLVHHKVRQYHAVAQDHEKAALIQSREQDPHKVRTQNGTGKVYTTNLLGKILCLLANKLATLDPFGIGVEMEAEKPNWYDSLNGLPGLIGSSTCESFELKRWIGFVLDRLAILRPDAKQTVALPEEVAELLTVLEQYFDASAEEYWRRSSDAREDYRGKVRLGFSGKEVDLSLEAVSAFLRAASGKVDRGLKLALDEKSGLYRSYFYYDVQEYTVDEANGQAVVPTRWSQHALPLFLEGIVHALRTFNDAGLARSVYRAVRRSPLFDKKLSMYKVCESLASESEEIGRCRVFNPGWLENESIWLHMEYKYLLELLRSGLYAEFHEDLAKALVVFQPPKRYGRSILENSSFLVSSGYPDPKLHGAGFVARLSGATAEFLHIWLGMAVGLSPFSLDANGQLQLRLQPVLTKPYFTSRGDFAFTFLGKIAVRYINPKRKATFGPGGVVPSRIRLTLSDGKTVDLEGGVIPAPYAAMTRSAQVKEIEVRFS